MIPSNPPKISRGMSGVMPVLQDGQLYFTEDTNQLWVGSVQAGKNVLIGGTGSNANLIGDLDANGAGAKGVTIQSATGTLYMQSASGSVPGLVNTTTQSFAGNKTFTGSLAASNLSGTNTGDQALNVKAYGAKGDGTTDDTAAINAAISAASAAGGATVFFPPSTAGYLVSSTITIPANVALEGTTRDNTVIKAKAGFTGTYVLSTTAINVAVLDLIVNCNSIANLSGIQFNVSGAAQSTLARVKVINLAKGSPFNNIGIYFAGFNAYLRDIEIDGGVIFGIELNGASDVFAQNLLCVNSDIGLALYGCEQVHLSQLQMDSCNSNYVVIDTSHNVSFDQVHCFYNTSAFTTTNNQVGILIGQGSTTYTGANLNSDIQLSNVTLRNFGQGTAADIGIELYACENLVMGNVSIANTSMNYSTGGTIGVGIKYVQGSNTLSGTLANVNFKGLSTNESGTAPVSNWTILSDQVASNTSNISTNTSAIAAINAAKGAASGFASLDSSGLVPITQIPPAALERLVIVANQTARFALTTATVQNGDTVKQTDTGEMWYVVDQTNLGNSAGYSVYTAGTATSAATATAPAAGSAHGAATLDSSGHFQSVAPGTAGHVLRSNGTDYVDSAIQAGDVPTLNQATTANAGTATAPAAGSAHGVVTLDSSAHFQSVAPSTNGNVLQSNGTDWVSAAPAATTYKAPTITRLTSTGSTTGYLFTITTSSTCAVNDTYTNNGNTYTVLNALSAQSGQILFMSGAGAPQASGNLTRATGSGTATIAFTSTQALATYTTPTGPGPIALEIEVQGGGGGGCGTGTTTTDTNGNPGGLSVFGTNLIFALGGSGGGKGSSTGIGGAGGSTTINAGPSILAQVTGSAGQGAIIGVNTVSDICGGMGGASTYGGTGGGSPGGQAGGNAVANSGSGGGGGGTTSSMYGEPGGGAGGFVRVLIASPAATYVYCVGVGGTGGAAGTSGVKGGDAGSGAIVIKELYQ